MLHEPENSRSCINKEYQVLLSELSDEDRGILEMMGPEGIKLKYDLKKEERENKYANIQANNI